MNDEQILEKCKKKYSIGTIIKGFFNKLYKVNHYCIYYNNERCISHVYPEASGHGGALIYCRGEWAQIVNQNKVYSIY